MLLYGLAQIATDNEMIRKFGRNVLHTKGKLSKIGGKNSLNSPNGLRVLSCSSKVAFFLDFVVAAVFKKSFVRVKV